MCSQLIGWGSSFQLSRSFAASVFVIQPSQLIIDANAVRPKLQSDQTSVRSVTGLSQDGDTRCSYPTTVLKA